MKQRGGKRPGAGRPKGSPNKIKLDVTDAVERVKLALAEGVTPLEYLLEVMRDESLAIELRLEAAKAAAPFCHRRQPVDLNVETDMSAWVPPPVVLVYGPPPDLDLDPDERDPDMEGPDPKHRRITTEEYRSLTAGDPLD